MALPREPRQKMINMMYLVLTALLALNVSSEILNAFKTVNKSLEKTNETISASTGVYNYIQSLKDQILTEAGGNPKDSTVRYKEDNLDIATRIMIEKGAGQK